MEFKEITAKTVDEAITKACLEFETSSDNLEIQVVQEGTSGFLGFIGSKPAVIKVRKKVKEEEFDILKERTQKRNQKRNETGKRAEKRNCHKNTDREQGRKTGGKRSAAEAGTEKTGCPYRRTGTADETGCRKISDRRIWCNGTSGGDYHEL